MRTEYIITLIEEIIYLMATVILAVDSQLLFRGETRKWPDF